MAVPVKFSDIGKSVSDLLKPDYSAFGIEVNTTTVNGVKFTTALKKSDAKSDISGDLKTKYVDAANGITFNYSFNTDRKLVAKAEAADSLVKGVRVEGEVSIKAEKDGSSSKGIKFGFGYKQEHLNTNTTVDLLNNKIPVTTDFVVSYEGVNLGAEVSYSLASGSLTSYNSAISYSQPDYAVAVHAAPEKSKLDVTNVTASYYHQLSNQLGAGTKLSYNLSTGATTLAVGTVYTLDSSSSIKANLDSTGKLGLQYSQKLRPGVKATFGSTLNWSSSAITADTGLSLTFDA